ncbi:MAG: LacI family DNA-binding transcriptional regulator [Athalassotoga sp.]|uniref:LacI family DNA-binding transcriptional regulator n=1 Tax=Athalassotoga sp. TaxID=2022597 RepID=UPI003D038755
MTVDKSIKDVAKVAGVSISTVSRVLNDSQGVREELKQKVLDAVQNLNYHSNAIARALKGMPMKTLGLLIPSIENPFFPSMVRGVQDEAHRNGYTVFLCNTDGSGIVEETQFKLLLDKKVDGVILVASKYTTKYLKESINFPVVMIDRYVDSPNLSYVTVDHAIGVKLALDHLYSLGHRNIAFFGSKLVSSGAKERFQSYKRYLYDSKIEFDESLLAFGDYTYESGIKMTEELLKRKVKFDAIFCGNDLIAFGVIEFLKRNGINVPKDVSVVGYDDISFSSYHTPKLTTVHQPTYEVGQMSTKIMLDMISGVDRRIKHIKIEPSLVVRETTRRIGSGNR